MLNIEKILSNREQCLGHTGLTPEWFAYLVPIFGIEYGLYADEKYEALYHKERDRARWWGNQGKLDSDEKKLFFVLYFLKTYQTYETLWSAFDMARPRAYEWIQSTLTPLFNGLKKTEDYLEWRKKSWVKWCENIENEEIFLSTARKDQLREIQITHNRKKSIREKRKGIQ